MIGPIPGWLLFLLLASPAPRAEAEAVTVAGVVTELAPALETLGIRADPEQTSRQIVLKTEAGTIEPLIADEGSRALFRDQRLRDRRAEIKGKRFPGLPYLQVVTFRVEEGGRLATPEYDCDICVIRSRYPQPCPCCQGELELRFDTEAR